ncbi:hypothetical protein ACFQVC_17620 [Streptomyces monticola]|uniref:DMT family transporter n=1 Tax=Streptomyces monticola TaxID=2666263 RepID=A0ABW2JK03_9ACTN
MGGSLLVVAAILMQATSNGLLSENLGGSESVLLSFIAFGASALVFGAVAKVRGSGGALFHGRRLRLLLAINAATAITFLGFYWSLSLIPAPLAAAVETGIGPLAMAFLGLREAKGARRRAAEFAVGLLTLALALAVAGRLVSAGEVDSLPEFFGGVAVAALAGVMAACIALLSFRFGQLKVSPVQVTAHRFHLTYLLALGVLLSGPGREIGEIDGTRLAFIAVVALAGAALPLFILQIGMQRTSPLVVALLASAVPSLTYLMAALTGEQGFDPIAFVLINGCLAVAFLGPKVISRFSGERIPQAPVVRDGAPGRDGHPVGG